jgi:ADP-L-glycero-D-manno-heptose 6-epimerase
MIVVTGSAGFIGSCLVNKLNNKAIKDIVLVDDFSKEDKQKNWIHKKFTEQVNRNVFFEWLDKNASDVSMIFHLGARTDTALFDKAILNELNLSYSKKVFSACTKHSIPLVYASSAATYGDGSFGFNDTISLLSELKPLNPYGESKNEFDKWVIQQKETPPFWAGFKLFNVFGPNEYHKGRMASVVFHAYHQIIKTNKIKLFKSHHPDYKDGEQLRDFIYVKDVIEVFWFLLNNKIASGIYNLGTGKARTFNDLALALFAGLNKKLHIEYIDTPEDIRDKYQYFTEANMDKLRSAGYTVPFFTLEHAIEDYLHSYLIGETYY